MSEHFLANLIAAAGGEIVGRTRLQKIVYILDQLGQESGLHFDYHHYGPYSEELADQVEFSKYLDRSIKEETRARAADGAKYSVFSLNKEIEPKAVGNLSIDDARRYLDKLMKQNATVLELAATIHWLRERERVENWQEELKIRKGAKVENGRMEKAVHLIDELGM